MNKTNNSILTPYAQSLRRKMTKEERHLWYDFLKNLPVTINRQKVIGRYIVDFYCAEKATVIELDGTQHYLDQGIHDDRIRDAYLKEQGLTILRYSDREINQQFKKVCQDILVKFGME